MKKIMFLALFYPGFLYAHGDGEWGCRPYTKDVSYDTVHQCSPDYYGRYSKEAKEAKEEAEEKAKSECHQDGNSTCYLFDTSYSSVPDNEGNCSLRVTIRGCK